MYQFRLRNRYLRFGNKNRPVFRKGVNDWMTLHFGIQGVDWHIRRTVVELHTVDKTFKVHKRHLPKYDIYHTLECRSKHVAMMFVLKWKRDA